MTEIQDSGQAGAFEIEITREMIDAGVKAIQPWVEEEWFCSNHRRLVVDAFLAMQKLSPHPRN